MSKKLASHVRGQWFGALALFLVLATGGAYALDKLGAKGIKDNAIQSRHIAPGEVKKPDLGKKSVDRSKIAPSAVDSSKVKKGSLKPQDFASGVLPAMSGEPGPQGPRGPSDGYFVSKPAKTKIPNNYTTETVGLDLPAGSYVVHATTTFVSGLATERISRCVIVSPASPDPQSGNGAVVGKDPASVDGEAITTVSFQTAFTLTSPGRVQLNCGHDGAVTGDPNEIAVEQTSLSAIRVETLTTP